MEGRNGEGSNDSQDPVLGELKKYTVFALSYLDKALGLHFKNPFRKWRFKTYIYKQKTFDDILQRMTTKKLQIGNKKVIVGFGNWGNPSESIIQGYCRGLVQEVKNKLQKCCAVVDVDDFCTSKLCCQNGKKKNSVLHCSNNKCRITIDCDINGARNIYMLIEKMVQKER